MTTTTAFQVGDFVLPCSLRAYHSLEEELENIGLGLGISDLELDLFVIEEHKSLRPYRVVFITSENTLIVKDTREKPKFHILVPTYVKLYRRSAYKKGDSVVLLRDLDSIKKDNVTTVVEVNWRGIVIETLEHEVSISEEYVELYDYRMHKEPKEKKTPMEPYRLSFISLKKGRNRPATNMFQMVSSQLAEVLSKPDWKLTADGDFGTGTDKIACAIQKHYGLGVDGWIGKGSWKAMTADLPDDWRAPLRYRIAECQCTFESGKKGYGYYGAIYVEGWLNYGIWNCNRYSAKKMVELGGVSSLKSVINLADAKYRDYVEAYEAAEKIQDEAAKKKAKSEARVIRNEAYSIGAQVGAWYGSKKGRETQVGIYFLKETIRPSIRNLVGVGFPVEVFGISNLDDLDSVDKIPNSLDPFYERLLTLACDITVNSGASGFQPKKSPRAWGGSGSDEWPADRLPPKEDMKKVFEEAFGGTIDNDHDYLLSDSRDNYRQALKKGLWELCETDEQRIELIAELQGRCIVDRWRDEILRRRRCVARKEGGNFQSTHYCISSHFGIGIE